MKSKYVFSYFALCIICTGCVSNQTINDMGARHRAQTGIEAQAEGEAPP